ncbi:MAG: DHH family phosphoesterase, partial [Parasporobacterium sp.]|nr:DHH family phosphoesterase [Parasporobacterium sp.]
QRLISFVKEYGNIEGELIADFPLPYCVTDMGGAIIISNDKFSKFYDDSVKEVSIFDIFGFSPNYYIFEDDFRDISVQYNQREYRIRLQRLNMPEEMLSDAVAVLPRKDMQVMTVYLFDETEIVNMVKAGVEQQLVAGTIYVDNYEETLQQTPYVDRSMVMAKIDQIIEEYFTAVNGIVRKVEKDKYFVIFKRKHMPAMQRTKFDILDSIKAIKTGSEMPITISVGVGVGGDYPGNFEQARQALDLALGRGGDQVVVKEGERIYFYGGKTKQSEKNTRVKARVTAQQLKEIIQSKERVVVMGHKVSDIDSFGASVGIYKAAKALGKKAYIVINELTNTVQPVLETFLDDPAYAEGVFLSVEDSYGYVNDDTLLVVVDVNKPDYFEVPTLIYQTKSIVLVDHHLQTGERIDHLVLSYVEPTASSASEMVTEILQYITSDLRLAKNEAEALYAGILIDTNY